MTGLEPKQSTNFLVEVQAPFDARLQVTKLADLVLIPYPYKGMIVSVTTADNPMDNGIWYRSATDDTPTTIENLHVTWVHLGTDPQSIVSSIPEVATLTALYNIGDADPALNESIRRAHNMVLVKDYNSLDTKTTHTPSYTGYNLVPVIYTPPARDINGNTDISDIYWETIDSWYPLGMLKRDITVVGPGIGLATTGKVYKEGTLDYYVVQQMLTTKIPPIYTQPALTLSTPQVLYDGSTVNIVFTITYVQGDAGSTTTKTATLNSHSGNIIAMGSIVGNILTFYNIPIINNDLVVNVTYTHLEGVIKNDNLGNPYPATHILAGDTSVELSLNTAYTAVRYSDTVAIDPTDYISILKATAGIPFYAFETRAEVLDTVFKIDSTKPLKSFVLGIPLLRSTSTYNYKVILESSGANITSDIVSVNSIYYNELGSGIPYQTLIFNGLASINDILIFTLSE